MKHRHKAILAVYLLLNREGAILLSKRCHTGYCDDQYGLPSGHVEKGESLLMAMVRETKEEIGLDIEPDQLVLVHVRDRNAEDGHRVDFFFSYFEHTKDPINTEPEKCSELRWVTDLHEVENIIPYIKEVLEFISKKIDYSLEDW